MKNILMFCFALTLAAPALACDDFDDAMNELEQKTGASHHAANTAPQTQQALPQSAPVSAEQATQQAQQPAQTSAQPPVKADEPQH